MKRVNLDMPLILARIAKGEYVAHLAKEVGLAKQVLRERVVRHPKGLKAISKGFAARDRKNAKAVSKHVRQLLKGWEKGREGDFHALARVTNRLRSDRARTNVVTGQQGTT